MPKFLDTPQWYGSNGSLLQAWETLGGWGQFLIMDSNQKPTWWTLAPKIYCHWLDFYGRPGSQSIIAQVRILTFDADNSSYESISNFPLGTNGQITFAIGCYSNNADVFYPLNYMTAAGSNSCTFTYVRYDDSNLTRYSTLKFNDITIFDSGTSTIPIAI